MNTKPAFSTFACGGCSQATGEILREILPTAEWDRERAEHDFACGWWCFSFTMRIPFKPIGGRFTADADDAHTQAITASSAAAKKRTARRILHVRFC
jgi:hypothetical protein